jgi:hypothetical protein
MLQALRPLPASISVATLEPFVLLFETGVVRVLAPTAWVARGIGLTMNPRDFVRWYRES